MRWLQFADYFVQIVDILISFMSLEPGIFISVSIPVLPSPRTSIATLLTF
jgi:hypothetical protein